jgi:hypothetical protein
MGLDMTGLSRAGPGRARRETSAIALRVALALSLSSLGAAANASDITGSAGQPFAASRTYWQGAGTVRPAWFICSPIDGADVTVISMPDAKRQVRLMQPLSRSTDVFRLGQPDPGAGQIYWPLSLGRRQIGQFHAFNPGMLTDPKAATTPTFTSIRASAAQLDCRWLERTRLIGFSAKRTIAVTQAADGRLEYRTFDFKDAGRLKRIDSGAEQTTTTSLDIKGGRLTAGGFEFRSGAITYDVRAGAKGASISVTRGGRQLLREPLIAWTIAPAP